MIIFLKIKFITIFNNIYLATLHSKSIFIYCNKLYRKYVDVKFILRYGFFDIYIN